MCSSNTIVQTVGRIASIVEAELKEVELSIVIGRFMLNKVVNKISRKKTKELVIIITIIVIIFGYGYYIFKINEITNRYDWVTLMQIKTTLSSIVVHIDEQYQNKPISKDEFYNDEMLVSYFDEMYINSVYISKSPNFRGTRLRLYLDKISELNSISVEEIEYLNRVQANYNTVLDEINDEQDKNIINRMFGVLNDYNAKKLAAVFEELPEKR